MDDVRRAARVVVFFLLAVLAGVAPACAGTAGGSAGGATDGAGAGAGSSTTPRQGGTLTYPLLVDPRPFDPALNQYDGGNAILHQVYEGLVRWEQQPDGTLKTVPCLAESWSSGDEGRVWTFTLRRGVMFQAPVSREVTAADVVGDLRYIADPSHKSEVAYSLQEIEATDASGYAEARALGVEAVDRYTVRITLKRPFSEFPESLGQQAFWVWPADRLRAVGVKAYARHPVGTGPFVFFRRSRGSIDIVRNPEWWDTSGGPYLDSVHYQVFSSATSMMLAFQKGEIAWTSVPAHQVEASRSLPRVKSGEWTARSNPLLSQSSLSVNMNDPVVGGDGGLPLRQALAFGCDREGFVAENGPAVSQVAVGLVPPGVPGSQLAEEPYSYDAARAGELYRKAGSPTLELIYPKPFLSDLARSLAKGYAKAGIKIRLKGLDPGVCVSRIAAGQSQLFPMRWFADYPSMDDFLYPLFHSDEPETNWTFYADPEVDALLEKARATPDEEARVRIYSQAERRIMEDAPVVPLSFGSDYRLSSSAFVGLDFDSMDWVDLWKVWLK